MFMPSKIMFIVFIIVVPNSLLLLSDSEKIQLETFLKAKNIGGKSNKN